MSKILTAEEFLIDWMGIDNSIHPNIDIKNQWLERKNQLIKFAKLHVEKALESVNENAKAVSSCSNFTSKDWEKGRQGLICVHLGRVSVCKDSIVNAYPLTNIE